MNVDYLVGKTIVKIEGGKYDNEIKFHLQNGDIFRMYHSQDCCEDVSIDDICGYFEDLLNTPILQAEEKVSRDSYDKSKEYESFTWTFYTFATIKGYVDIRWFGSSNGYYSEGVDTWLIQYNNEVEQEH